MIGECSNKSYNDSDLNARVVCHNFANEVEPACFISVSIIADQKVVGNVAEISGKSVALKLLNSKDARFLKQPQLMDMIRSRTKLTFVVQLSTASPVSVTTTLSTGSLSCFSPGRAFSASQSPGVKIMYVVCFGEKDIINVLKKNVMDITRRINPQHHF
jgi:hypothetical protein